MKQNNSNSSVMLLAIMLGAIIGFVAFSKKAFERGKTKEWFFTTFMLFFSYYALFNIAYMRELTSSFNIIQLFLFYLSPLIIYSLLWAWLFSQVKVVSKNSVRTNINWNNKKWWWNLDGWEFEEEVARVFKLNGFTAKVTKKTGDGGTDIILYDENNVKYIVQCKHYQSPIPVKHLRELNGIMDDFGADKAIMVASSGATQQAQEFLSNKPYIILLTLDDIIEMGLNPAKNKDNIEEQTIHTKNEILHYLPNLLKKIC